MVSHVILVDVISGVMHIAIAINSLYQDGADVAIVGSLTTHFTPAPFGWANATGVASPQGRSASFSIDADGYSPSVRVLFSVWLNGKLMSMQEGAVFFVLRKQSAAVSNGDVIHGM